jgi:hypothetical protein
MEEPHECMHATPHLCINATFDASDGTTFAGLQRTCAECCHGVLALYEACVLQLL